MRLGPACTFTLVVLLQGAWIAGALADPPRLHRTLDPVVISGEPLQPLWDSKAQKLRLMAERDGNLVPIPYQIDKRAPDGEYLISGTTVSQELIDEVGFDNRPESEKRAERIEEFESKRKKLERQLSQGELPQVKFDEMRKAAYFEEKQEEMDYNDELAFMARDAGGRVSRKDWPTQEGVEIELTDPLDGSRAWAYLLHWREGSAPAPSAADYVLYDAARDAVDSDLLHLKFVDGKPLVLEEAAPKLSDGTLLANLVDRFKMRIILKPIPFFCASLRFDETNIKAFTVGYKDGPVRVIRRNIFWITIAGIKLPFVPQALVYYTFYDVGLYGPAEIQNPFNPKYILCEGSVGGGGIDFRQTMHGARAYTADNPGGGVLDGRLDTAEKKLVVDNQKWTAVVRESDEVAFLIRIVYGKRLQAAGVNNKFFFMDDASERIEPESEPGSRYVGFGVNILEVPKGTFKLWFYMYVARDFQPGDERAYLDILDHPLQVRTEPPGT